MFRTMRMYVSLLFFISILSIRVSADDDLTMPDLTGSVLSEAHEQLREAGFQNVTHQAAGIILNTANWTVIYQNAAAGSAVDPEDGIVLTCIKTTEYLEGFLKDLHYSEMLETAKALGYTAVCRSRTENADMTGRFQEMNESQANEWKAVKVFSVSNENRTVQVGMLCTGVREVPDVREMSLHDAMEYLEDCDFSSVLYKAENGDPVWYIYNWVVAEQSAEPGSMAPADSDIILTVTPRKVFGFDPSSLRAAGRDVDIVPEQP